MNHPSMNTSNHTNYNSSTITNNHQQYVIPPPPNHGSSSSSSNHLFSPIKSFSVSTERTEKLLMRMEATAWTWYNYLLRFNPEHSKEVAFCLTHLDQMLIGKSKERLQMLNINETRQLPMDHSLWPGMVMTLSLWCSQVKLQLYFQSCLSQETIMECHAHVRDWLIMKENVPPPPPPPPYVRETMMQATTAMPPLPPPPTATILQPPPNAMIAQPTTTSTMMPPPPPPNNAQSSTMNLKRESPTDVRMFETASPFPYCIPTNEKPHNPDPSMQVSSTTTFVPPSSSTIALNGSVVQEQPEQQPPPPPQQNEPQRESLDSDSIPSMTSTSTTSSSTDNQNQEKYHLRNMNVLSHLYHASRCNMTNCTVLTHCAKAKTVWNHCIKCKGCSHCTYPRRLLRHFGKCQQKETCVVCGPFIAKVPDLKKALIQAKHPKKRHTFKSKK